MHCRGNGSDESHKLKNEVLAELLKAENAFEELEISDFVRDEMDRHTELGQEFTSLYNAAELIPTDVILRMIRKVIYSADGSRQRFILTGFPDTVEQAGEFEANCAYISACIYTSCGQAQVDITGYGISSIYQKAFKLKILNSLNKETVGKLTGNTTKWGIISGRPLSGRTTIANQLAGLVNGQVLNMASLSEGIKGRLGTEDEPFEGDVPIEEIQKEVEGIIAKGNKSATFIFDGHSFPSGDAFANHFITKFGAPQFWLRVTATNSVLGERYKKKNEVDEIGEEVTEEWTQHQKDNNADEEGIQNALGEHACES